MLFIDTYQLNDSFVKDDLTAAHWNWLKSTLEVASKAADWVIVVGDQSPLSSGKRGGSRVLRKTLLPLLKEYGVDMYISGDDYDMELIQDGSLALLNCGNGAFGSGKGLRSAPGSLKFLGVPGFCLIKLNGEKVTTEMYDGKTGQMLWSGDIRKFYYI